MSDLPCYRVDKDDKSFCQLRKFHRGPCDFSRSKPCGADMHGVGKCEVAKGHSGLHEFRRVVVRGAARRTDVEVKVKISFEDLKKAYEAALAEEEG